MFYGHMKQHFKNFHSTLSDSTYHLHNQNNLLASFRFSRFKKKMYNFRKKIFLTIILLHHWIMIRYGLTYVFAIFVFDAVTKTMNKIVLKCFVEITWHVCIISLNKPVYTFYLIVFRDTSIT